MLDYLRDTFDRLIDKLHITTYRYLYEQFHTNNRLTGLIGPRGVGKTTLLLQHIKHRLRKRDDVFYFSADHFYFAKKTLLEFVHELYTLEGIRYCVIDEVHKYPNWSQELKNIYDSYPDLHVVFSGSSSVDLIKGGADLSRRLKLFTLTGLSFREYLNFVCHSHYKALSLSELLEHPDRQTHRYRAIPKLLGYFKTYLACGYYPFIFEDQASYYERIERLIEKAIFEDIANCYNVKTVNLVCFKSLLNYLATIPPGEVNSHNLARHIGIDNKTVQYYLEILEKTRLIRRVYPKEGGNVLLRKPAKIFLDNTALLYAMNNVLGQSIQEGTLRELFFVQSLCDAGHHVHNSRQGDFLVKDNIFEIGGRNKTKQQINQLKKPAFLVKDDVLTGGRSVVPLWAMGLLY